MQLSIKIKALLNSSIGKRIANGALWSFGGTAVAKLLVLISGIICAHILGKASYGEFSMIRSTISMFVVFGTAGLGMTATKYISEYRQTQSSRIGSIYLVTNIFALITSSIVTIIVLSFSDEIASNTLHSPQLVFAIRIGAILLFVTILNGAQNGVLAGFENFKGIAINTFIGSIAESVFMIVFAQFYGVEGAIFGFGIGFMALYITNFITIHKTFRKYSIKANKITLINKDDLKLLYKFSLPAAISSMLASPAIWLIRTFLVNENGFEELAVFEAADQWRIMILFIPTAVSQIVLPILSSVVNVDKSKFWKVLYLNIFANGVITLLITIFVVIFSQNIMNVYGKEYDNEMPLIYLAISTIFSSISSVIGLSIASKGKMWVGCGFNLLWALLIVIFAKTFIAMGMGANGVALAVLCSYIIHSIYQYTYLIFNFKNNN